MENEVISEHTREVTIDGKEMTATIKAYTDFSKANKVMGVAVQIKSTIEGKKGKTTFQMPVFNTLKIADKTLTEATALDVQLQEYLKLYLEKNASAPVAKVETASKPAEKAFDNSKHKDAQHSEVTMEEDESDITFAGNDAPYEF